ncbi:outer membrane beta-barrel protein [Ochrobactrum sp. Marseille-Q0166]|uniref:outer membrane beta-barrel protein n=1 Tax=Ochrobactrum sp. Marseille-Q0166 TaxID=2761105 RepID=UPI001656576F|nr:outer membrane beta-barrel protein [Ochrobactrum sp. Marseille-Q0166]MBC8718865.1 outer membrane beta-barrel protein [Ochrobactrum sp. Marseille-Q0166]
MLFANIPSGGLSPFARRLRSLLLAGCALAISNSIAFAQDTQLRGALDEDGNLPISSSEQNADRDIDPANPNAPAQDNLADDSYTPPPPPQPAETAQAATITEEEAPRFLATDNMPVSAVTTEEQNETARARRENLPALPEQGRRVTQEADPFAPIGIRAGTFVLRPTLEQGIRATTNGDNSSTGSSAVLSETTLRLNAESDWGRHQAKIDASGTMSKSISGQDVSEPRVDVQGNLRFDLSDQITVNAGAGYKLRRESASSPNGVTDALKRPLVHTINGSLGIERDTGLLFGRATGHLEHEIYGDAELSSGGNVSQKDRDNTYASVTLRGGFAISPALKPFAEVELGKRMFDERVDSNGYERSGSQYAIRGGLMFDRGEKFNGEFSAGFMRANSDDSRLADVSGPSLAARINWSPLRGTDVQLYAQTTVDTSTTPGVAGALLHFTSIEVKRQMRSDLSLNGKLDLNVRDNNDGTGTDYTVGAQVGATYWINRFVGIDARLRHEFQTSKISYREYHANSIYVGMKVQR